MPDDWLAASKEEDPTKNLNNYWFCSGSEQPGPSVQSSSVASSELNSCRESVDELPADLVEIEPSNFDSDSQSSLRTPNFHGSQYGDLSPIYQDISTTVSPVASNMERLHLNSPPINPTFTQSSHWSFAPLSVQPSSGHSGPTPSRHVEPNPANWVPLQLSNYTLCAPSKQLTPCELSPNRLVKHNSLPDNYTTANENSTLSNYSYHTPNQPTFIQSWPCTPMHKNSYQHSTQKSPAMPQLLESPQSAPAASSSNQWMPHWVASNMNQRYTQQISHIRPSLTSPTQQATSISPTNLQSPDRKQSLTYQQNPDHTISHAYLQSPGRRQTHPYLQSPDRKQSLTYQQSPGRRQSYPYPSSSSNFSQNSSIASPPNAFFSSPTKSDIHSNPIFHNLQPQTSNFVHQQQPTSSAHQFAAYISPTQQQTLKFSPITTLAPQNPSTSFQVEPNSEPEQKRRYVKTASIIKQLEQQGVVGGQPSTLHQQRRGRPPGPSSTQRQRSFEPKVDTSKFTPEQLDAHNKEQSEKRKEKARLASIKCHRQRIKRIEELQKEREEEEREAKKLGQEIERLQRETQRLHGELMRHRHCRQE